ncbi:unnamed protein product [Arabis nemorensis]|uniref:RNase H type-1 domain-containing protein n=1 Tax=Arabis nemorensis TaxID=586526 RepID=A0A565BQS3_9BRAS|nr:unnamed protein product [Arabis nemorensis]
MNRVLIKFDDWRMVFESRCANRAAFLIAHSVTLQNRWQSYIAQGAPSWLVEQFENERKASVCLLSTLIR